MIKKAINISITQHHTKTNRTTTKTPTQPTATSTTTETIIQGKCRTRYTDRCLAPPKSAQLTLKTKKKNTTARERQHSATRLASCHRSGNGGCSLCARSPYFLALMRGAKRRIRKKNKQANTHANRQTQKTNTKFKREHKRENENKRCRQKFTCKRPCNKDARLGSPLSLA